MNLGLVAQPLLAVRDDQSLVAQGAAVLSRPWGICSPSGSSNFVIPRESATANRSSHFGELRRAKIADESRDLFLLSGVGDACWCCRAEKAVHNTAFFRPKKLGRQNEKSR